MTLVEKIKYLKKEYGIEYKFIARKIGVSSDRLSKFMKPVESEYHRKLRDEHIKKLKQYLSGFVFPQ